MASDDNGPPEESRRVRIDPPHYLDWPHLHGLRITKTADAVILSGRIESTDRREILRVVETLLSELGREGIEDSGSDRMKESRSDSLPEDSGDTASQEEDILNWDNLIPVPPARPSGRIQVRIKKAQRDKPAPADDPWAK